MGRRVEFVTWSTCIWYNHNIIIYAYSDILNSRKTKGEKMLVDVTDKTFESEVLKSDVPVLIDMWAPWCGPCRMVAPVLEKLSGQYEGKVKFCRLNVDENQVTPSQYGVRSIPNMLFIKDGKVVDTAIGALPEFMLQDKVDGLLKAG